MRIAYVTETYPPELNGVALTTARTVRFLRERRHPVLLVRPAQAGERAGAGKGVWRTPGWPIPMYPELRFGLARVGTLAARFAAFGAERVHVATEGPLGWAAVGAARRLGLPVTSDFRTHFERYSQHYRLGWLAPLVGAYLRFFHNRTDRTFAPTHETAVALRRTGFERVEVVARGVDLERFAPTHRSASLRTAWQAGDGLVLLSVGRVAAEKNIGLALRAYAAAREAVPSARMVVVGDGPRRAALEAAWPGVVFAGRQTGAALAAHYASADLFVFPSLSETFGNVTLEALASGLPVIAYDTAAAGEHVRDGVSGRLVAPAVPTAPEDFIDATVRLVADFAADPARRPSFGAAARASVAEQDWDTVLGRFEAHLLETALDSTSARPPAACVA